MCRNQTRWAYETIRKLTSAKQRQLCAIKDKSEKSLTNHHDIIWHWTEYYTDLYKDNSEGNPTILLNSHLSIYDNLVIL